MDPSAWPEIEVANMFGAARSFMRFDNSKNEKLKFAFIAEALATKGFLHSVEEVEKAYNFHLKLKIEKKRQENGTNHTKTGTESSATSRIKLSGGKKSDSSNAASITTGPTKHVNGQEIKQTPSVENSTVNKTKNTVMNLTNQSIKVTQRKSNEVGIDKNAKSNNNPLCLNSESNKGAPEIIQSEIEDITSNISKDKSLPNPLPKNDISNRKETIKKQINFDIADKKEMKGVVNASVNKKRIKTTLKETNETKINYCIPNVDTTLAPSKSIKQSSNSTKHRKSSDISRETPVTSKFVQQLNCTEHRKSSDITNETAIKSLTKKNSDAKIDERVSDNDKTSATSESVKQSNCTKRRRSSDIANETAIKSLTKKTSGTKIDERVSDNDKTSATSESVKQSNCTKHRRSSDILNETDVKSLTKKTSGTKIDERVSDNDKTSATSESVKQSNCTKHRRSSDILNETDVKSLTKKTSGTKIDERVSDNDKTSATSESVKQSNCTKHRRSSDILNETDVKSLTKKTSGTKIDERVSDNDKTSATSESVKQSNCTKHRRSSDILNETDVKSLTKKTSGTKIDERVSDNDKTSATSESVKQSNCTKHRRSSDILNETDVKSLTKKTSGTKIDERVSDNDKTSATSESVKQSNCTKHRRSSDILNETDVKSLTKKTSGTKIDERVSDNDKTSATSESVKQSNCTKHRRSSDILNETDVKSLTKKTSGTKIDERVSDNDKTSATSESVKQSNCTKHRRSSDILNETDVKSLTKKTSGTKIDERVSDNDKTSATSESVKQSNCTKHRRSSDILNETDVKSLTKKTSGTKIDERVSDNDKTSATSESVKQSNCTKHRRSSDILNETDVKSLTKKTSGTKIDKRKCSEVMKPSDISNQTAIKSLMKKTSTKIDEHISDIDKTSTTSESVRQSNCTKRRKSSISNQTAIKSLRKETSDTKIDEHVSDINKTLIASKCSEIRSAEHITNKNKIQDILGTKINVRMLDKNTISITPGSEKQSVVTVNSVDSTKINNNNIFAVNNKSIEHDQTVLDYLKIMPSKNKTNYCGGKKPEKLNKNSCNSLKHPKDKKGVSADENINASKVARLTLHDKTSMRENDPELNGVQVNDSETSITTNKEIPNTPTEVTQQNSQDHGQQLNSESVLISEQKSLNTKQVVSNKPAEPSPTEKTSKDKSRVDLKALPCGCQNICTCNFNNLDETVSTTKETYTSELSVIERNSDSRTEANVCTGNKGEVEGERIEVRITRNKRHKLCLCNEKVCICHFENLPTSPLQLRSTRSSRKGDFTLTLVQSHPAECKTSTAEQHTLKNVPTDNPEESNFVNSQPKPQKQISERRKAYMRARQSRNQRFRRQRKAEMMRMANAAKYNWGGTNSATFKVPYYNNPYTLKKQQYWKAVAPQHHRPFIRIKDFARENNFTRGKFYNRFRDSESVARGSRLDTFGNGLDHSEQLVIHDFNSYTSPLVECATPSRGTAPLNRHRETRSDTHVQQSMRGMSANGKSPCKHRPMKEYYGEGEEERNLEDIKMGHMSPRSEDNKPQVVILPCDKPDLDMPFFDIESKEKFLKSQQSPPRCNMEEVKQLVQNPDVHSEPSSFSRQTTGTVDKKWNDNKEFRTGDIVNMYRNPSPPLTPNTVFPPSPSPAVVETTVQSELVTTDTMAVPSTSSRPSPQVGRQMKKKRAARRMEHFERLLTTVAKNQMKLSNRLKRVAVLGKRVAELSNDMTIVKKSILDLKETGT
ncbi:uncharacterized protein LOC124365999 isoform X2 [Homalodisca vitripennis]|uniref:uncharacterized protein LOC124365999 isoform X2 n=1 Tax=Homalodisca vitripennis TaxID=197043 RepID=UPI001EEB9E92|nr:uncharacterized protein LOC124365999 isoform X2 [Homalodisca vitripennis]